MSAIVLNTEGLTVSTYAGIRGVQGEFYPCKPDIFEATYEPAAAGVRGRGAADSDGAS